ncbi:MAG: PEGA domain-containing protein [Polyangiaceae bacterium]
MPRVLPPLTAAGVLLGAALLSPAARAQPAPTGDTPAPTSPTGTLAAPSQPADRADELFAQANEAFDAGKLQEAYDLYQQAWALKRTYDIAGNLGQVELKLGKFRDAAQHLEFTLRLFPPTGKSEPREAIRRAFEAARKEVGTLSIRVNVRGAEVSIDGASVGLSPFDAPVFVEPGKRVIEATLEAHLPTRIELELAKNESRDLSLALTPKAQPPPPPRNVPLLLTGFGVSLAAAGTGIGLMLASTERGSDADALLQQLHAAEPDGQCPCGTADQRADLKGLRQDHDLYFNLAVGMFVGAGVLAVGTAAYALTPSFQKPSAKSAVLVPVVSDRAGGAVLIGTF